MPLTPIARFDVVPRQRIEAGETFNFGVVAFSKGGIQDVVFTITPAGGSYGGTSPATVTTMALNPRTNVWEYWVAIATDDFDTDGSFTVGAVITGDDAGSRDLGTITMFANPGASLATYSAWVDSVDGNDGTGTVDDDTKPYETIDAALSAIETANGNEVGGCSLYFEEGTYESDYETYTTTNEWLTIEAASGATKANVQIIGVELYNIGYLKFKGVHFNKTGGYTVYGQTNLWFDDCNCTGSGRANDNSTVVQHYQLDYATDCYFTDSDWGVDATQFARNCTSYFIGQDNFQNCACVISCAVDDISGSAADPIRHSDALQWQLATPFGNWLVYGYKATNCGYEGMFIKGGPISDIALVNVLVHMGAGREGNGGIYIGDPGDTVDHVIMWNCTMSQSESYLYDSVTYTNCSVVGNLFYTLRTIGAANAQFNPGNESGNEALDNHFTTEIHANDGYIDSDAGVSKTAGDPDIDTTNPLIDDYGRPNVGSPLLDRLTSRVPIDINNLERGATSCTGAVERPGDSGVGTKRVMVLL